MTCIKTGASCHFANYGTTISVDLFKVGEAFVISTHPGQVKDDEFVPLDPTRVDLEVFSDPFNIEYWSPEKGVFVVDGSNINWHRMPKPA